MDRLGSKGRLEATNFFKVSIRSVFKYLQGWLIDPNVTGWECPKTSPTKTHWSSSSTGRARPKLRVRWIGPLVLMAEIRRFPVEGTVVFPIIYRGFSTIPGRWLGMGFQPSTVSRSTSLRPFWSFHHSIPTEVPKRSEEPMEIRRWGCDHFCSKGVIRW